MLRFKQNDDSRNNDRMFYVRVPLMYFSIEIFTFKIPHTDNLSMMHMDLHLR